VDFRARAPAQPHDPESIWYLSGVAHIVLVEDADSIRDVVTEYLRLDGHEVSEFERGEEVVRFVGSHSIDLCILDLMVPGKNGFQIAKEIRAFSHMPILFLTARDDEASRITGFEIGGDDYIVKPFSPRELVLRVNAILRRGTRSQAGADAISAAAPALHVRLQQDDLRLSPEEHRVYLNEEELELTATEWRILHYFMERPGRVVPREQLMESVLDYSPETSSRTVDSHVKNLRSKLGNPGWLETVRGLGYRFTGTTQSS
jgi:DNA-binding response OmpR family regulator